MSILINQRRLHIDAARSLLAVSPSLSTETNQMHIPSLFVGSVVSGSGFLLVHRELSHRQRLSTRWIIAEQAEKEINKLWRSAKSSISKTVRSIQD